MYKHKYKILFWLLATKEPGPFCMEAYVSTKEASIATTPQASIPIHGYGHYKLFNSVAIRIWSGTS